MIIVCDILVTIWIIHEKTDGGRETVEKEKELGVLYDPEAYMQVLEKGWMDDF